MMWILITSRASLMNCLIFIVLLVCASIPVTGFAQERRTITISNATLSYSALPLVAAREWKLFEEQALNVEVILMRSAAAAAALVSGDLDYQIRHWPGQHRRHFERRRFARAVVFDQPHYLLVDGQTGV
jgi:ABC-type nitrate/sulfonate/bicarbonate transport system substrate-binding protein